MESCLRCGAPADAAVTPPAPSTTDAADTCRSCGARLGVDAAWCGLCLAPIGKDEPAAVAAGVGSANGASNGSLPAWASESSAGARWHDDGPTIGGVVAGTREPWEPSPRRRLVAADRWRLFLTLFCDLAFYLALAFVMVGPGGLEADSEAWDNTAGILMFLNRQVLQGLTGWTVGRWATGVKLVRIETGGRPGVIRCFLRDIAHIVDTLALMLGWLLPLWDPQRQTIADKIVGTMPVNASRQLSARPKA